MGKDRQNRSMINSIMYTKPGFLYMTNSSCIRNVIFLYMTHSSCIRFHDFLCMIAYERNSSIESQQITFNRNS